MAMAIAAMASPRSCNPEHDGKLKLMMWISLDICGRLTYHVGYGKWMPMAHVFVIYRLNVILRSYEQGIRR